MLPPIAPKTRPFASQLETVSVYTRHSAGCAKSGDSAWRRCQCVKYIYTLQDGKRSTFSANTRSWGKAEDKANEIRNNWDPVRRKLLELEQQQTQANLEEVSLERAVERWLQSLKAELDNEYTFRKYETAARKILDWASVSNVVLLLQVTADALDMWKAQWKLGAKRPSDRMGRNTAGRHLEKVKAFARYCQRMGWTTANASLEIKAIRPEKNETLPLLGGRYEHVLEATYVFDEKMRPNDRYGAELRALFELQRWTGLRISDALTLSRERIEGNRFTVRPLKAQGKRKITLLLPDHVIVGLQKLPVRTSVDPRYFFWSGRSKVKTLTSTYQKKIHRLNDFVSMQDYEGHALRFNSHQLRDTFAVEHLLAGTSMQDLSVMLGHASVRVTESYYAPWVPERQVQLEQKMLDALQKMGAKFSFRGRP